MALKKFLCLLFGAAVFGGVNYNKAIKYFLNLIIALKMSSTQDIGVKPYLYLKSEDLEKDF